MAKTQKPMQPIAFRKVIGLPYQGTHGKQFNQQGGSDNWESENAVDLAAPVGTPVYAVESGTIGSQIGSQAEGGRFAGQRLHLVTKGNEFYYGHLSAILVHAGETVKAGQLLGYSGAANGVAHLHFASKTSNPAVLIGAASKETVLPASNEPNPHAAPDQSVSAQPQGPTAPTPTVAPELPPQTEFAGVAQGGGVAPERAPGMTQEASYWAQIAGQPYASPEAQMYAQNAQLAGG